MTAPSRPMSSRKRRFLIAGLCGIVLVLGGGYLTLRWIGNLAFPRETTDIRRYGEVMKQWSASGLVSEFPPTVPSNARNVHFAAFPGPLQAAAYIQLRIQLPPDEIRQIEARLKLATSRVYAGGGMYEHYNRDPKMNVPTTDFHTADDPKTYEFPEHYRRYVLEATDHGGGSWNNGETRGVAVSTDANEVIYWAEIW